MSGPIRGDAALDCHHDKLAMERSDRHERHDLKLCTNNGKPLPYRRLLSWHAARTLQKRGRLQEFQQYDSLSDNMPGFKVPPDNALAMLLSEGMRALFTVVRHSVIASLFPRVFDNCLHNFHARMPSHYYWWCPVAAPVVATTLIVVQRNLKKK